MCVCVCVCEWVCVFVCLCVSVYVDGWMGVGDPVMRVSRHLLAGNLCQSTVTKQCTLTINTVIPKSPLFTFTLQCVIVQLRIGATRNAESPTSPTPTLM